MLLHSGQCLSHNMVKVCILIAQDLILICFYPVIYCTPSMQSEKHYAFIEYSKRCRYALIVRNDSELQKMSLAQGFI